MLNLITQIILFIPLIIIIFYFFSSMIKHHRDMKELKEWSEFRKQTYEWALEISDSSIRDKYILEQAYILIEDLKDRDYQKLNIEDEKIKIYLKWGKHIPSLLQDMRENKLNKLVKF